MFKKIFMILIAGLFLVSANAFAMMCHGAGHQHKTAQAEEAEPEAVTEATPIVAVDVGNKICPVSGDKIDEAIKATYEYEGKIYNFCCPMCIEEFKKDPDKYIKKVEEELKTKETTATESEPMQMPEGHQH
ncbi:MAG: YHS domain-containing protein [Candidatus Omnitrophota bacterium]